MNRYLKLSAAIFAFLVAAPQGVAAHPDDDSDVSISINHVNRGVSEGTVRIKSDALDMRAKWDGKFSFNDNADGFESFDGRLEIEDRNADDPVRMVMRGGDGEVETEYFVRGRRSDIDATAETRMAGLIRTFALETGLQASERVETLYARGGADAVFAE
ncbi:MAG: hypothetical protein AAGJ87_12805, partial [Pseudomonadota bacterium]